MFNAKGQLVITMIIFISMSLVTINSIVHFTTYSIMILIMETLTILMLRESIKEYKQEKKEEEEWK